MDCPVQKGLDSRRRHALSAQAGQFVGAPLLDGNRGAIGTVQVEGAAGRGDIERQPVARRGAGQ
jgi:hypothetical protein